MNKLLPTALGAALAVPVLVAAAAAPAVQSTPEIGDTVDYKFRSSPIDAMGITGLDELRGKPVLIEFWGTY